MKKLITIAAIAVGCWLTYAADFTGLVPSQIVFDTATNILNGPTSTNWNGSSTARTNYPTYLGTDWRITNVYGPIDCRNHKDIALQFKMSATAACTTNVEVRLARNLTGGSPTNSFGTGLDLDIFLIWTNVLSGTTPVITITNLGSATSPQLGAIPYLYVYSIGMGADNDAVLTNYSFRYFLK